MTPPLPEKMLDQVLALLAAKENSVFLETTRITDQEFRSFLFLDPVETLTCLGDDDPAVFFQKAQAHLRQGHYLAGWFAYEFGYLLEPALKAQAKIDHKQCLAWLGVYQTPHIYNHKDDAFSGAGPWPQTEIPATPQNYAISGLSPNQEKADYLNAINRIKAYIEAGDTYQVNYTLKLIFDFAGSPAALYRDLRRNQSVSFGSYIRTADQDIMSFSPELFFKKEGDTCTVRPMKGTVKRGLFNKDDRELGDFLQKDIKNRSENVMIVDLLRNDLGRICESGTVKTLSLFDLETYETLHQMTSTIQGRLKKETDLNSLFRALFPCGSVTGAPKIRTMEIIHELEQAPRGIYTGGIGFITPGGEATFNVPIRTVQLAGQQGAMGIGSGVVYDSVAEQEWQECLLKGNFLVNPAPCFELIETILWQPGQGYWLLDDHLARLADSAAYFRYPYDQLQISKALTEKAAQFDARSCQRVRLTLAKDGAITIQTTPCPAPADIALPPPPANAAELPKVTFSKRRTDPQSPYLYHKTTVRELYNGERDHALANGFIEVLFTNLRGEVTEGSITSIFIKKENAILTPPLQSGLLAGVFRKFLLNNITLPVREKVLLPTDLEQAEAIYIGNSVRGLIQVQLK
ncbi:MAG: aminodeoxychorismate synthase component I [Desulfobulbaceae bacterium]|nr:aminodeoxychorismate synthase component I [Desulfobulbaceae bacterium]HIJ78801.1 aminodeoxychorismate synthase component I [Deltaproteobacteria bacterium]